MASKDGPTGLLAKMARMLRAPAQAPGDAAESVQGHNSELDQKEAQARIAAKRRDDMVRRREFDHLRKVRAQGAGSVGGGHGGQRSVETGCQQGSGGRVVVDDQHPRGWVHVVDAL